MTTLVQQLSNQSYDYQCDILSLVDKVGQSSLGNVDKVVQSVTNATKRLSQISTNTNNSNKKRKTQNKIGPWKLGRTLGRGSTGRVRLAKNIMTGKLAAVKIVPKSNFKMLENPKYKLPNSPSNKDRLPYGIEREIIIMKLISHPNIMGLYDVWENKNDLYLILEYIEGGELFDYLIKRGRLQEFEAINYFKQIINGINYLHQFNICHRDLKPENLLLDFNKNIKIADFGMAALEVREKLLETSCGSPHYASPEIVAGKNYHGAPSDIWSCGIILFALLTGHLPFDDENIRKLLLKVQNGKFVMPPDLSWEAKDLITKMLQVNPKDRITIDSILTHPLLTKYPDSPNPPSSHTTLDFQNINIRAIDSVDKIDKEILKNLSVLFHNCDEQQIISKLLSPNKCSEKMFYYLLMKYRNEHTSYDEERLQYISQEEALNDSRQSLPRSTSIVKTTVYDQVTGEKHTTIKKLPNSSSTSSANSSRKHPLPKSYKSSKVLANITKTSSQSSVKSFKASSSFNMKKTLLNNQVISRNASTLSKRIPSMDSLKSNKPPLQDPPKMKRKLTGHMDLNTLEGQPEMKAPGPKTRIEKPKPSRPADNKSLLNFGIICDEMFAKDDDQSIIAQAKPNKNSAHKTAMAKHERDLAAKVHAQNELREEKLHQQENERLIKQERIEERKRQSTLLQEKQRQAIEKLRKHQSSSDFANVAPGSSRRTVTEPPKSSLDPRNNINSLLRAKSLASPSSYSSQRSQSNNRNLNDNTSKVLHKFGIDIVPSPRSRLSSHMKTSSSKNLSDYLKTDETRLAHEQLKTLQSLIHEENDEENDKENDVSVERFNERELIRENGRDRRSQSALKTISGNTLPTTASTSLAKSKYVAKQHYKSLLDDESSSKGVVVHQLYDDMASKEEEEEATDDFDTTIPRVELIPNPRFSRFSFGGLLNNKATNEVGDITILNNTLTNSATVKRKTRYSEGSNYDGNIQQRKSLKTVAGNGLLKKSSTINLLGLGINANQQPRSLGHSQRQVSNTSNHGDQFVSIDITASSDEGAQNTFQASIVTMDDDQFDVEDNDSDETMLDEFEVSIDKSSNTLAVPHNKSMNRTMEEDYSNFDLISSRTADIGKVNTLRPSIIENLSKETLLQAEHDSGPTNDRSIKSMYRNYESLYTNKRQSKNLLEINKPILKPETDSQHSTYDHMYDVQDDMDRESGDYEASTGHRESEIDDESIGHKEVTTVSKNFEILDTLSIAQRQEEMVEDDQYINESEIKKSSASTEIFSTMNLASRNNQFAPAEKNTVITEKQEPIERPVVKDVKHSLFRKMSLKPKRPAPKAPKTEPAFKKRFSRFSAEPKATQFNEPPIPAKSNWFKKFLKNLKSSSAHTEPVEKTTQTNSKDIFIIDSNLISSDLIRVIKTQLELKKIEGSICNVDVDEEFGLISGVIPSKFAHGRKLKFKFEIIDLINSSSLHLIKVKGNDKGFKSLINSVNFVIKHEEEATNKRKSNLYQFSGYKK
jgi:serine/threonine-protein kinase HSL1 (negative regulator of Swe1 kinase)